MTVSPPGYPPPPPLFSLCNCDLFVGFLSTSGGQLNGKVGLLFIFIIFDAAVTPALTFLKVGPSVVSGGGSGGCWTLGGGGGGAGAVSGCVALTFLSLWPQ